MYVTTECRFRWWSHTSHGTVAPMPDRIVTLAFPLKFNRNDCFGPNYINGFVSHRLDGYHVSRNSVFPTQGSSV